MFNVLLCEITNINQNTLAAGTRKERFLELRSQLVQILRSILKDEAVGSESRRVFRELID